MGLQFTCVAGDIHIWDRDSGALLHYIREQTLGAGLTCIAWNHANDSCMFATGSHDGTVKIWAPLDSSLEPLTYSNTGSGTPNLPSIWHGYDTGYRPYRSESPFLMQEGLPPIQSGSSRLRHTVTFS